MTKLEKLLDNEISLVNRKRLYAYLSTSIKFDILNMYSLIIMGNLNLYTGITVTRESLSSKLTEAQMAKRNEVMQQNAKPFLFGAAAAALILTIGGQFWPGYQLDSTAAASVATASESAVTVALAPICAERFLTGATEVQTASLGDMRYSRERSGFIEDAGYATFAGSDEPNSKVAVACANMLEELNKS